MSAYYNEFDPFAADWLEKLIANNLIAPGDVDRRSITEVSADDLKNYAQCHFFAGIGGWSLALRLAGWDDARPVWTGSAPCQPFSSAGKQAGKADERHLFPVWLGLIRECRPPIIFGEQVSSAIAHGWLDDVYQGLESEGYAVGSAVLPACSVGAPHKRDRCWFVADAEGLDGRAGLQHEESGENRQRLACDDGAQGGNVADPYSDRRSSRGSAAQTARYRYTSDADGGGAMGHPYTSGLSTCECVTLARTGRGNEGRTIVKSSRAFWADAEWLACADGKARPVKPGLPLLAHGISNRVGKLRGYGNAIVPQVAAEFIKATM